MLSFLLLAACERSFVRVENLGFTVAIERSYEAREACLVRNTSAEGTSIVDPETLAHAAAVACQTETNKCIAAITDGDPKVTASICRDTEFRAMKYVMQARHQGIF